MFRFAGSLLLASALFVGFASAEDAGGNGQPITLDVFVRGDQPSAKQVTDYLDVLRRRQSGLEIRIHDLIPDRTQLPLLMELSKKSGREKPVLPAFHSCDRTYFGFIDAQQSGPQIERLFTADIYTRLTCTRCQDLKAFLPVLKNRWPAIRFQLYEVDQDPSARVRWQALCQGSGTPAGLPTIDFARRVIIGYQGDSITGEQIQTMIEQVAVTKLNVPQPNDRSERTLLRRLQYRLVSATAGPTEMAGSILQEVDSGESDGMDLLDLPEEATPSEVGEASSKSELVPSDRDPETIEVPIFGRIRVRDLGLPLFTLAVGLVDGFNPCAMWVLVFLLSVLVNIKDRKKILIIAGTFVVVSGLAYFTFMAAWLNLFLLVGIVRPVQVALALLALFIGVVNVKDFFAFKKGISLSIPEGQKPGLYRRVREIVNAKYLPVALGGAVVLAIVVNMVELLCTAGLPALYTQILTLQELPPWMNYLYLGLYILAYMFDDMVLVGVIVATLSHRKLQEREGRWLKLISGLVILLLGLVMLFAPQWLQLGGT